MTVQALIATQDRKFALESFPMPTLMPDEVRIQPLFAGVSMGTEFMVIQGYLDWRPFPVCTGYQATGRVIETGAAVDRFQVGGMVYYRCDFIPFTWQRHAVNSCAGTHAVMAVAPQNQKIDLLPAGVSPRGGSMFVMPAVGYNAVKTRPVSG